MISMIHVRIFLVALLEEKVSFFLLQCKWLGLPRGRHDVISAKNILLCLASALEEIATQFIVMKNLKHDSDIVL